MNDSASDRPFDPSYADLNALITLLSRFTSDFVSGVDRPTLLDRLLAGILTLTNAHYGFVAEGVGSNGEDGITLDIDAMRNNAINGDKPTSEEVSGKIEIPHQSLLGDLFQTALPIISNDYRNDQKAVCRLPGNPDLINFIAIPLQIRNQVIGLIGIGNRERGFDRSLAVHLAPIANNMAALIEANRNTEQAYYDPLTGLPNEQIFLQRYQAESSRHIRKRKPLSLLYLEVDHLNNFRNNYGHMAVETCLKQIAATLSENLRVEDCVVRAGPDQFAALLTETPNVRAVLVAEKLRQALGKTLGQTTAIAPTVSIGLTSITTEEKPFDTVLKTAKEALKKAQDNGGNQVQIA